MAEEGHPLPSVYTIPMLFPRLCSLLLIVIIALPAAEPPDWKKIDEETLRIYQSLVRIDSTDPPGNETRVVDYVKTVLDAEGIPYSVLAKDPARANITARLKGNTSKRPLLIIGHSDTVKVDEKKWTYPPFQCHAPRRLYLWPRHAQATRTISPLRSMTLILLKRQGVKLDRDVIFLSEAGEEAATDPGIGFLVNERWSDVDAEYCLAEGGSVVRRGGEVRYALIQTAEKSPQAVHLTAHGPAGHGSRPLRTNSIVHLSRAVETIAVWDPPIRFNDTTRHYFEKLASVSGPEAAARYNGLFDPAKSAAVREYLANNEPGNYSMLHTSISPNIIKAGYQINVIPSTAEAELDVRAATVMNAMTKFVELIRNQINDPSIDVTLEHRNDRPHADPSSIRSEAFSAIEAANQRVYSTSTIPVMSTGATDMAFLRCKGNAMLRHRTNNGLTKKDAPKGFRFSQPTRNGFSRKDSTNSFASIGTWSPHWPERDNAS